MKLEKIMKKEDLLKEGFKKVNNDRKEIMYKLNNDEDIIYFQVENNLYQKARRIK